MIFVNSNSFPIAPAGRLVSASKCPCCGDTSKYCSHWLPESQIHHLPLLLKFNPTDLSDSKVNSCQGSFAGVSAQMFLSGTVWLYHGDFYMPVWYDPTDLNPDYDPSAVRPFPVNFKTYSEYESAYAAWEKKAYKHRRYWTYAEVVSAGKTFNALECDLELSCFSSFTSARPEYFDSGAAHPDYITLDIMTWFTCFHSTVCLDVDTLENEKVFQNKCKIQMSLNRYVSGKGYYVQSYAYREFISIATGHVLSTAASYRKGMHPWPLNSIVLPGRKRGSGGYAMTSKTELDKIKSPDFYYLNVDEKDNYLGYTVFADYSWCYGADTKVTGSASGWKWDDSSPWYMTQSLKPGCPCPDPPMPSDNPYNSDNPDAPPNPDDPNDPDNPTPPYDPDDPPEPDAPVPPDPDIPSPDDPDNPDVPVPPDTPTPNPDNPGPDTPPGPDAPTPDPDASKKEHCLFTYFAQCVDGVLTGPTLVAVECISSADADKAGIARDNWYAVDGESWQYAHFSDSDACYSANGCYDDAPPALPEVECPRWQTTVAIDWNGDTGPRSEYTDTTYTRTAEIQLQNVHYVSDSLECGCDKGCTVTRTITGSAAAFNVTGINNGASLTEDTWGFILTAVFAGEKIKASDIAADGGTVTITYAQIATSSTLPEGLQ